MSRVARAILGINFGINTTVQTQAQGPYSESAHHGTNTGDTTQVTCRNVCVQALEAALKNAQEWDAAASAFQARCAESTTEASNATAPTLETLSTLLTSGAALRLKADRATQLTQLRSRAQAWSASVNTMLDADSCGIQPARGDLEAIVGSGVAIGVYLPEVAVLRAKVEAGAAWQAAAAALLDAPMSTDQVRYRRDSRMLLTGPRRRNDSAPTAAGQPCPRRAGKDSTAGTWLSSS